jgi:hypothetical protein
MRSKAPRLDELLFMDSPFRLRVTHSITTGSYNGFRNHFATSEKRSGVQCEKWRELDKFRLGVPVKIAAHMPMAVPKTRPKML